MEFLELAMGLISIGIALLSFLFGLVIAFTNMGRKNR